MIKESAKSDAPTPPMRTALRRHHHPFPQETSANKAAPTANSTESLQWRRHLTGDRGSASVELVIATPILLFLILLIVQFGLWSHATHIAQAAASNGLTAARVYDGTAADGAAEARNTLELLGDGPLENTSVTASRDADTASLRVEGTAYMVIPFLTLPVHATATGPIERFVSMGERP
jgi:hypothetical protein